MEIRKATRKDAWGILALALLLWPDHESDELYDEITGFLADDGSAFFIAVEDKVMAGFAQCALRHDYVEGTDTSPVGYLEGIYVREPYRRQGIARALSAYCEQWAKERSCTQFASDCLLENAESIAFHHAAGYGEANRIVCFIKSI